MTYSNASYDSERALYGIKDSLVSSCRFEGPADGESALKESSRVSVENCFFDLRYPFWHMSDSIVLNCTMTENCRAAFWYDRNIKIESCRMEGIKALRECENVTLLNTKVVSPEFIWKCRGLVLENVNIEQSEYPFFEVEDARINALTLNGKYSFQYNRNILITNSRLDTKDAFWHTKDVTVRDTVINGEYLGWYSENLTLINCQIRGTQPFCYCKNLVLQNCTLEDCDLAFERSTVQADVQGKIDSIKNPLGGKICAGAIGQVIMEDSVADRSKTQIIIRT